MVARQTAGGDSTKKLKADGRLMLDPQFPYGGATYIEPVGTILECNDSPGQELQNDVGYDKIVLEDKFNTYLIYQPKGTSTIWVTLAMMGWGWSGTATKNSNGEWTCTGRGTWGGQGTYPVTALPTWTSNITQY